MLCGRSKGEVFKWDDCRLNGVCIWTLGVGGGDGGSTSMSSAVCVCFSTPLVVTGRRLGDCAGEARSRDPAGLVSLDAFREPELVLKKLRLPWLRLKELDSDCLRKASKSA